MILLDLGAENNMYHADISRTYPLSGKFNDLQRKIMFWNDRTFILKNYIE